MLTFNAARGTYGSASGLKPDDFTTWLLGLNAGDVGGVWKESVFEVVGGVRR
jgi:hypothetical protein